MPEENENEDEDEESCLGLFVEHEINRLAALFYQMQGSKFMPEMKFRESAHPDEYRCWNQAVVAFSYIKKDDWYLKFQVS